MIILGFSPRNLYSSV